MLSKRKHLIWTPLQIKIFVLVVSLFSMVFALTLLSIYNAAYNQAERQFLSRLSVGRNVFLNELANAKSQLDLNVETVSKDWALRSAIGQGEDSESIRTILFNFGSRIDADVALVLDKKFTLISQYGGEDDEVVQALGRELSDEQKHQAWITMMGEHPFLVSAEPIRAPGVIGWLIMGKKLNLSLFNRIKSLISLDINLTVVSDNQALLPLSTINNDDFLNQAITKSSVMLPDQSRSIEFQTVDTHDTVLLPFMLFEDNRRQFVVVLQDSIQSWLKTLRQFMFELLPFFAVGLLLAVMGSYYIARSITRPVGRLLDAAKLVASGKYNETIQVSEKSELGELALEFGNMQHAVMEREQKIKDQAEEIRQTNKAKYQIEIVQKEQELAKSANEAKNRFLANVSHEIRTPLNSIIGYTQVLDDAQASHQEKQQATQAINSSGQYLLNIINDVLDLSKIEAGKIHLQNIDTCTVSLLNEVQSYMRRFAAEKSLEFNLQLHFPLPRFINTDPTRLKQILLNLCNNAIKFTDEGKVELQVYFDSYKRRLIFVVSDSGVGMSEEQQLRLFTAFSQGSSAINRKYGGTGLGLYISKQLIEIMGGHIKVTSQEGEGSQFAVYLPWAEAHNRAMLTSQKEADDIAMEYRHNNVEIPRLSGHILCVDDNQDNLQLVAYLLRKTGVKMSLASSGFEALELAKQHRFELILMDMQMPDMDGLETTQRLLEFGVQCPILMLTANVDSESIQQVMQAGATAHFGKPIKTEAFYAKLTELMDLKTYNQVEHQGVQPSNEFERLIEDYKNSFESKIADMQAAADLQDWHQVQQLMHKLKGSAGSYGFDRISELAKQVEDNVTQEHFSNAIDSLNQLKQLMREACAGNH
ncbi:ATP-binding protein [Aliiglaciecola sp. SL4]|uniref:ATP-binding protein n=1 Tax=Aliiglaciecola sp. SL4 TaxID=3239806 RepID=UPI00355C878E